jgi:acyl-CoA synthetase (AMP-forming)/AMP-acid ligase II
VAAGGVPCIGAPFSLDDEQRKTQIKNIHRLLKNPVILTNERLRVNFAVVRDLTIFTFREVNACRHRLEHRANEPSLQDFSGSFSQETDNAVLILTSGSSGDAKAVALQHRHILAAVKGKSELQGTTKDDNFLNWIGLDHVANLTEIHMQAMYLGSNQVCRNLSQQASDCYLLCQKPHSPIFFSPSCNDNPD